MATGKKSNKDSVENAKVSKNAGVDQETVKYDRRHDNPGRPSSFTPEVGDAICSRMSDGESLRAICREEGMPHVGTFLRWVANDSILREQYETAMEQRADAMFEEMFQIADETNRDNIETENGDRPNAEWISRSRLRVDVRKWALSKMMPKKYGDKVALVGDPQQPLQVESSLNVTGLSTQALAEIMAARDASESK